MARVRGMTVAAVTVPALSACDAKPGFPMADWASKRRSQIQGQTA